MTSHETNERTTRIALLRPATDGRVTLKHVAVGVGVASALLASTAAASPQRAMAGTQQAATTARALWTHTDYAPVTQPAAVAGRILVYTASGGALSLRAVDPVTGRTAWVRPATRSYATVGVYTTVTFSGATAYYYRPVGSLRSGAATLAAIDVTTGRDVWVQSGSRAYIDMPDVCRSIRPLLCMTAYEGSDVISMRVDGVTGQVKRVATATGRQIGPGLYSPDARDPERIERIDTVTGRRIWALDLRTLSPSRPITTDHGWSWDLIDGVYVGWVAFDTKEPFDNAYITFDLAKQQSFGVRASDGKVLWRAAGNLDCLGIKLDRPVQYRCVGSGTSSWHVATSTQVVEGADVTLERFDARTGRTIWSAHIGDAPATFGAEPQATSVGHVVTIPLTAGGAVTLNMVDGKLASAPGSSAGSSTGGIGWCTQEGTWHSSTPLPSAAGSRRDFPRFGLVQPCTADAVPAAATSNMPTGPAVVIGGVLVWSSKDGLHGVRVR